MSSDDRSRGVSLEGGLTPAPAGLQPLSLSPRTSSLNGIGLDSGKDLDAAAAAARGLELAMSTTPETTMPAPWHAAALSSSVSQQPQEARVAAAIVDSVAAVANGAIVPATVVAFAAQAAQAAHAEHTAALLRKKQTSSSFTSDSTSPVDDSQETVAPTLMMNEETSEYKLKYQHQHLLQNDYQHYGGSGNSSETGSSSSSSSGSSNGGGGDRGGSGSGAVAAYCLIPQPFHHNDTQNGRHDRYHNIGKGSSATIGNGRTKVGSGNNHSSFSGGGATRMTQCSSFLNGKSSSLILVGNSQASPEQQSMSRGLADAPDRLADAILTSKRFHKDMSGAGSDGGDYAAVALGLCALDGVGGSGTQSPGMSAECRLERNREQNRQSSKKARMRRKGEETSLKEQIDSIQMFQLIVEGGPDMMSIHGLDYQAPFRYASSAFQRVADVNPRDLLGKKLVDLVVAEDHAAVQQALHKVVFSHASEQLVSYRMITPGGKSLSVETSIRNGDHCIICVAREVGNRHKQALSLTSAGTATSTVNAATDKLSAFQSSWSWSSSSSSTAGLSSSYGSGSDNNSSASGQRTSGYDIGTASSAKNGSSITGNHGSSKGTFGRDFCDSPDHGDPIHFSTHDEQTGPLPRVAGDAPCFLTQTQDLFGQFGGGTSGSGEGGASAATGSGDGSATEQSPIKNSTGRMPRAYTGRGWAGGVSPDSDSIGASGARPTDGSR